MAFSMFFRSSANRGSVFSQQLARLMTQPAMTQTALSKTLPSTTIAFKQVKPQPIQPVCSFSTTPARMSSEVPHDHARLWVIERSVSALMIPLIPAALIYPNQITDSILAILIVAHSFWGLEAITVDYVRASIFGPVIPKIAIGLVYALCIATLGGLFYIISHDIGIANTIKNFWAIKSERKA